jgi:hypothetical protein
MGYVNRMAAQAPEKTTKLMAERVAVDLRSYWIEFI